MVTKVGNVARSVRSKAFISADMIKTCSVILLLLTSAKTAITFLNGTRRPKMTRRNRLIKKQFKGGSHEKCLCEKCNRTSLQEYEDFYINNHAVTIRRCLSCNTITIEYSIKATFDPPPHCP